MAFQIFELLKYILPSLVVLLASYLIIQKFLVNEVERKRLAIFGENAKNTIQLRLQAYERLTIFIERIHPTQLIARFYSPKITAYDFQIAITQAIRSEFEHNLSQQIYVSKEVWETVKNVKEQEISMINQFAAMMPVGAMAGDLARRITDYVIGSETELPTEIALHTINAEAKKILLS